VLAPEPGARLDERIAISAGGSSLLSSQRSDSVYISSAMRSTSAPRTPFFDPK
jgi:hypothetical protein